MENKYTIDKKIYREVLKSLLIVVGCAQLAFYLISCEEFVDIDPPLTDLVREDVFTNDATATAAISGIYADLFNNGQFSSFLTRANGLASDELVDLTGSSEFFSNALTSVNSDIHGIWSEIYQYIFSSNAMIEGLSRSSGITSATKNQLEGEAKFIRALCNFYLVNLWGDIPLVTSTDYRQNALASRTPKAEVYQQIIDDLIDAQNLLTHDYSFSAGERGRPNKSAATALLARAYLYLEDWVNAEIHATMVINNPQYTLATDLNEVFLVNSAEAIWQLRSTFSPGGINTFDAEFFVIEQSANLVALNEQLVNTFETGDNRAINWIGSFTENNQTFYFPFKYKIRAAATQPPITEALTFMRLAEQFLIRAEARAEQGNISGAQEDLNSIRNRAGLSNTGANDVSTLLIAIEKERRVELFAESSHRWFDLNRTGRADAVLGSIKANWQTTDALYPIPQLEMEQDPNLRPQNPGY